MATTQTTTPAMSVQFGTGGSKKAVDTWHVLTNTVTNRTKVTIANNGVDNDITTGTSVYVTYGNTSTTPTISVTNPQANPVGVGDSWSEEWGNDVIISVRCSTADVCCHIMEHANVGSGARHSR